MPIPQAHRHASYMKAADASTDNAWKGKPLGPQQLLVADVRYEYKPAVGATAVDIKDYVPADLVVPSASSTRIIKAAEATVNPIDNTQNPIEYHKLTELEENWGWLANLRRPIEVCKAEVATGNLTCRWIHVSSKFSEYLPGFLWGLSDLDEAPKNVAENIRSLEQCVRENERYSRHGNHFAAFAQSLSAVENPEADEQYPILISAPFLDWSVFGGTPPLRFQVDKREGQTSSRSSVHPLRSILQHYYRLEETRDREKDQVFSRHRPWTTDQELDLRIRSWYGQYPTALNVDELWVLAIDPHHVVTFASNQTWKSTFPPLQLAFRIRDVSFRSFRSSQVFYRQASLIHTILCLDGAMGMLHRSFWQDVVLCLTDRYASYLGHLQYRIYRAPNTRLVMELLQVQEELNIIIKLMQEQLDLVEDLSFLFEHAIIHTGAFHTPKLTNPPSRSFTDSSAFSNSRFSRQTTLTARKTTSTRDQTPSTQLTASLSAELRDLQELLSNTNNLVNRTVQLVNIRLEDHGKAILVFTIVTIVFLPLNFVSSFFGMNVEDIRNLDRNQGIFWIVAACVTAGVVGSSVFLAFKGADILEKFTLWSEARRKDRLRNGVGRGTRGLMAGTALGRAGLGGSGRDWG
ncbi:CorA-like Mg2+ transporter-like protein 1 [Elsinoe australis]|uniref:CorA-like Mg2+ transporter-like protein 1 n=1 Tax=Elsinoe australis TaxID=40998 RepID=A0A4U7B5L7_9PEZI|nr:CorA-like Mg2+ transporter-like protein 1 [Elsinoe australis]